MPVTCQSAQLIPLVSRSSGENSIRSVLKHLARYIVSWSQPACFAVVDFELSLHTRAPTVSRGLPVHIWVPKRESLLEHTRDHLPAWPNMDEEAFAFQWITRTFLTAATVRVAQTGRGVFKRRGSTLLSSRQLEQEAGKSSSLTARDEQKVSGLCRN